MLKLEVEKKLATYLSIGTFLVSIFLLNSSVTDPVNVTKLFALGGVSTGIFGVVVVFGRKELVKNYKPTLIIILIFDCLLLLSSLLSKAPFSQNFYGTSGRNNGLLTYLLMSALLVSALLVSNLKSFEKVFYGLLAAGLLNVIYCAWVLAFGDFLSWSNPYGNILGFFGNPDFISAFLGMFITGSLAFIVDTKTNRTMKMVLSILILIAFYEIVKSHAVQGLVVTAGGLSSVGFFLVKSWFKERIISIIYSIVISVFGVIAIFGTLQKGPLSFVYKRSVSLRGSYWRAGIEMGKSHPFTGVGLDTYGDWYRRARPPVALLDTPGVNTLSNVSHNVVIDFFASGGFPLLFAYLAILSLSAISIIRMSKRTSKYDRVLVGLTGVWICYEVQSFISINQIGLAIWGWVFSGLLIGYEHSTRNSIDEDRPKSSSQNRRLKTNQSVISPQLIGGIGLIVGTLIALPPLSADSKWFNATRSHELAKVEASLNPSFFNPADSFKYAQAVQLFQGSNLLDVAHKYAIIATKFNPDYSVSWKQLYSLPNSTPAEKELALRNMKRLDPNNPDVISTQ